MSRIGRKPIPIPKTVEVSISDSSLSIKGPGGLLQSPVPTGISFSIEGGELLCKRSSDARQQRAYHGLARALAQNAIKGVSEGFKKELDIVGVGYRAAVEGRKVVLSLGYSYPIEYHVPDGVEISVDRQTRLVVSGIDRQRVGQVAADIRRLRKPDPYKQKGVRYVGEILKKKAGKAGAATGK